MKKYYFFICIALLFCSACKNKKNSENDNESKDIFIPILKNKLDSFFVYADTTYGRHGDHGLLYTISFHEKNGKQIVSLGVDFFYHLRRIKRYTFVNDRLVVYNGNYSDQKQYLLDTSKLTIFADTILGYRSDIVLDMDYEVIKQDYLICDKDSLSLIFSGFY